jgi:tetratricopeptide (TPR) repeat protein
MLIGMFQDLCADGSLYNNEIRFGPVGPPTARKKVRTRMIHSAKAVLLVVSMGAACLAQTQPKTAATSPAQDNRSDAYYHFAMGRLYAEMGQADGSKSEITKAIQNYEEALKLDPGASIIFEELSDLYIATNRLQDAIGQAEEQLKQNPDNLGARRMLAHVYMRAVTNGQNGVNEDALRKALDQYQMIVQKDPKDSESWVMLGKLNGYLHNTPEAEKAFNRALEIEPDSEDALVGLGELYGQLGDPKRAVEKLKAAVDKHPSSRTLASLATAYEDLDDYKDAADALRRALEAGSEDDRVPPQLANDLLKSGQVDEALKLYQEMAAQSPRDPQIQLSLCEIYLMKHDVVKARAAINKAKASAGNNPSVRYAEVAVLEEEGKNDQAIAAVKSMLDEGAKKTYSEDEVRRREVLLERLTLLYMKSDQTPQAVDAYRQIAVMDPSAAAKVELEVIEIYRTAKDLPAARAEADAAVKKYPKDPKIAEAHALVLADQGKVNEAVAELRVLKSKPSTGTEVEIAQLYEKAKRYGDMAKALDEGEKLAASNEDKISVLFLRGSMYDHEKKYDESEAEFRKVLAIDPDNANALNYLGYSLADRNVRLDEAYGMVKKALDLAPDQYAYMDSLAWVYYRQGKLDDAEALLLRALENTKDPTVHDHLGDVYFKEGKTKDAAAQWQASLKEYNAGNQDEADPEEMAKVTQKLQTAQAQLAKHQ